MATRMQQRKGTAAQWISTNSGQGPVLNAGEIGFEIDTNKFKIGDGVNHWVDLNYFIDGEGALAEITSLIDGAPAALNTLNELAAAINDDPAFFTTIATNLTNHQNDTTAIHGIADTSLLVTTTGTQTLTNKTITSPAGLVKADVGLGNVDNTSDANKPVSSATQTALDLKANTADIAELAQDAVNTAIVAGTGLDKVYDDASNTITLDIDSTVATKAYADQAEADAISTAATDATTKANAAQSAAAADATTKANAARDAAITAATNYTDSSVASLVDSAPGALNTLNELAAAINDDSSFAATVTASLGTKASTSYVDTQITNTLNTVGGNLSSHASDTTGIHGIEDTANLATQSLVNSSIATAIAPLATTAATTLAISTAIAPLATTSYVDGAIGNATVDQSSLAGVGIDYNASTDQFDIDSTVATKTYAETYADDAVTDHNAETLNIHGIANTALLATLNYVDTEIDAVRDDAAVAAATLLTGATKSNITITGNKNGLTITAENGVADSTTDNLSEGSNNKYFTDERAQDAVGNAVGTGLSYNDATGAVSVDTTVIQARVADISDTEIGYLNGVTSSVQTQIDTKAALVSPTFTGTVSGITKTMVGLGNVDNTADADKPVSTATQTALDLKSPLASPTFTGTVTTGHVLPATDITFDLGSPTKMWRDIYVGPGSLYVNGQKVLQTDAGDVVITADANENLALRTSGSGNIELDPTGAGSVNIKGPLVVEAGANFSSNDGNGIAFSNGIKADSIASNTLNTDLSLSGNGTGKVYLNDNAEVNGNLVVGGNLTVSGTTTTVNSETISLADNIIDLNSNFTTGTPTENSGLRIMRGDSAAVQIRWNESSDAWDFTNDGTNYAPIAPLSSPTFTGTVSGITKSMVGLGNVDNTTDAGKPISSATQTALDAKLASATAATTYAPIASPTFTGTVVVPTLTLTNPLSAANGGTGLSSLATGVATFLGTPSSANLAAMLTDEIGTGNVVLSEVATSAQTASYTLVAADRGKLVEMNVGSANTLTVPLNSSVAFPIGTQIDILQVGSGKTTVAGATVGVTINATPGLAIRAQWGGATLIKRAENTWVLIGDLTV
jgi:hypothetical protein